MAVAVEGVDMAGMGGPGTRPRRACEAFRGRVAAYARRQSDWHPQDASRLDRLIDLAAGKGGNGWNGES